MCRSYRFNLCMPGDSMSPCCPVSTLQIVKLNLSSVFSKLEFLDQFAEVHKLFENFLVLKFDFDCLKFTMNIFGDIRMIAFGTLFQDFSTCSLCLCLKFQWLQIVSTEANLICKLRLYTKVIFYGDFAVIHIEQYFPNFSHSSSTFTIVLSK